MITIGLILGPLLAGELAVRSLIAADRLPVASAHYPALEATWTSYQRRGPTDILVLGDSLARAGIRPAVLAELASSDAGRSITVHNLATPGAGFRFNRVLVQELGRQDRLPSVAIIGVSVNALERREQAALRILRAPLGRLFSGCESLSRLEALLSCRLESASALWRWRGQPGRLGAALTTPLPTSLRDGRAYVESDGYARAAAFRSEGELERQIPRALSRTPIWVKETVAVRHFAELVDALRDRDVRVVVLLLPFSPRLEEALEDRAPGWRVSRQSVLDRLAAESGFAVIDPALPEEWWSYRDSHDVKHLSVRGATRLTEWLWAMPAFRDQVLAGVRPAAGER